VTDEKRPPKSEQEQVDAIVNSPAGESAAKDLKKRTGLSVGELATMAEIAKKAQESGIGEVLGKLDLASTYGMQFAALTESIGRLTKMPPLGSTYKMPSLDPLFLKVPPPVQRPEVGLLRQVHAELVGLAKLIGETGQQTTAVVEVTRANLTALRAMLAELHASRESADRSSSALIWLTVALFAAAGVAAVAVLPQFVSELAALWHWLRSVL
jgi:hypothetical protein